MEFVLEFLFELIVEGIFSLTVENPKVKTWIKTAVFLIFSEAVAGFVLWLSFAVPVEAGPVGVMVCRVIGIGLGAGFLIAAIHGHKRDWKQK